MRAAGVIFLLSLVVATASAQFDVAVSGEYSGGHIPLDPHYAMEWTGFDPPRFEYEVITTMTAAPRGRVIAAGRFGTFFSIQPSGRTEIAQSAANLSFPFGMVASRDGVIYAIIGGHTINDVATLIAIEGGAIRTIAEIPFRHFAFAHLPALTIDLGSDQCTLMYPKNFQTVGRFNVCSGNALSDFAIAIAPSGMVASGVRILPDGGSLVVVGPSVRRLNAQGVETRSYTLPTATTSWGLQLGTQLMRGLTLGRDGRTFLVGVLGDGPNAAVVELELETGALVRARRLSIVEMPHNIVIADGWSAAFDNHLAGADVPSFGVIGTAALVLLLAGVAICRV